MNHYKIFRKNVLKIHINLKRKRKENINHKCLEYLFLHNRMVDL